MNDPSHPTPASDASAGVAWPHESASLHVQGSAPYTDDLPEWQGTLHGAFVLSPIAHGHFSPTEASPHAAVTEWPGVARLVTAADIPGVNDCGAIVHDEPILADGRVMWLGQPVALVLATTREQARRAAARAVSLWTFHAEAALLDPLAAHAAQQHVVPPMHLSRGDADTALAQAPHRLELTVSLGGQEQFYLEGQIALAIPQEDRGMRVFSSTQHPSEMQHAVAHALGTSSHQVQVECRRMGGGFGGKESQSAVFACAAAVGAWLTGQPVKVRPDRDDDFLITGRRHDFHHRMELGHDAQGRLLAARVEMVSRAGCTADLSAPVMARALCHFDNAYWLPHVRLSGHSARTHTQSNTAFRGFGGPQGAFAVEYALDTLAHRLGLDALDVRLANLYGQHERNTTPYGQTVEDNVLPDLLAQLVAQSDYRQRREAVTAFNAHSAVLKKGLALTPVKFGISFNLAHLNQAGALVHVYTDGTVLVNHGGTEMGQGLHTKVAQMVAHTLGVSLARVRVTATDTHKVPNTSATAASTGTDLNGKAAEAAARTVRQRLVAHLATHHGVPEAEVHWHPGHPVDGDVVTVGHGPRALRMGFAQAVMSAYTARVQLWSDGFYATPGLHWDRDTMQGRPFHYFAHGASVSEVLLDTLTGESRVLRADLLHDVGRSINPALDLGQVEGAFIQGMGWLTSEELWWHPDTGRLMTHAPSTYKVPTASDCPTDFRTALFDHANPQDTVHRSKAVGEPPLLLSFSVFFALRDAVASLGPAGTAPALNAPATPEALLRAAHAARAMPPSRCATP